ncbi:hypothetical protein [Roseibium alexandrii]|uniref:Uncharacterized protein n=1 Tax=Roseibium alexandrii TaxID=388408 RepID=A0A0M6ZYP5_9HYPH|nr:hypothetical protein [Roseibium alexandrii]CTQ67447.1 hypothetical protein LAX5112_01395 [Roseibium alexandrii]
MTSAIEQGIEEFIQKHEQQSVFNGAVTSPGNHIYSVVAGKRGANGIIFILIVQSYSPIPINLHNDYAEFYDQNGTKASGAVEFSSTINRQTGNTFNSTTYIIFQ